MPIYNYKASDTRGRTRTGTVDARTETTAVNLLKEQGLLVVSLSEKKASSIDDLLNFRGVPETELVAFSRQFSTMVSAGLPISKALEVLAEQTTNIKLKKIIQEALRDVEGGASLSSAFARHPKTFSPTFLALVRAGEASGKLDEILQRLASTMEDQRELRAKFKGAMIYPTIVFIAMIGVMFLMLVFVIPKLAGMYESMNVELPVVTQLMINISDLVRENILLFFLGAVGLIAGIRTFLHTGQGKEFLSYMAFTLPVFGNINKKQELTEFTRTLSLLISAAVPIVEALRITAGVVRHQKFKAATIEAATIVEKGNSLSDFLMHSNVFPPILGHTAKVGEETGQLDVVLGRLAEFFDSETEHAVAGLAAALEPIILIMLGTMVGGLIISIITPIYKITSSL